MFKKLTLLLVLAAIHVTADADMRTITSAYEINLSHFRAPGTVSGTLAIRDCSSCEPQTLRVDAATRYFVNNEAVSLADFRQQLAKVRNRSEKMVLVSHHLESDMVTAVRADL